MSADPSGLGTQPLLADRSLGELLSDMTESLGTIFSKEVELAKVEIKEEAARAARGGALLGGAAVATHLALIMVSFALAWWLDEVMHPALAFLLVGAIWAMGAAVMARRGRDALAGARPLPNTMASLKEDAAWVRAQRT